MTSIRGAEPWSSELAGRFDEHEFESDVLKDNPLGDPHLRPLWVYVPPGYDDDPSAATRAIYVIQGLTGQLDMWRNRTPFRRELPGARGRAVRAAATAPPVPPRLRRRLDVARRQPVPRLARDRPLPHATSATSSFRGWTRSYRTLAGAEHRGIAGKSSGGYGAMVDADAAARRLRRPGHARRRRALRDVLPARLPRRRCGRCATTTTARSSASGRTSAAGRRFSKDSDRTLLNDWCMAACYSADEDGTVQLPTTRPPASCGPRSGSAGSRWDPVRMVAEPRRRAALAEGDLHRLRQARPVLPRPRRGGVPAGARGDRRHRLLLRALRRHALGDRVPLPARRYRRNAGAIGAQWSPPRADLPRSRATGLRAAIGRQVEPIGPGSRDDEDQGRRRRGTARRPSRSRSRGGRGRCCSRAATASR